MGRSSGERPSPQLNVVWNKTKPTDMQKAAFSKAWELCGEEDVFHCVDVLWSEDV